MKRLRLRLVYRFRGAFTLAREAFARALTRLRYRIRYFLHRPRPSRQQPRRSLGAAGSLALRWFVAASLLFTSVAGTWGIVPERHQRTVFGTPTNLAAITLLLRHRGLPNFVVFPSPEVEHILGPDIYAGSALNPWAYLDTTSLAKGLEFGAAFLATPPTIAEGQDDYRIANYYDQALVQYRLYYRTGDVRYLTYARKIADSWWLKEDSPLNGTQTDYENHSDSPRDVGLGGLILRALDGRPEMFPWIRGYVDYQGTSWVDRWAPGGGNATSTLPYGIRDPSYMVLYYAWMGKADPDGTYRTDWTARAVNGAAYFRLVQTSGGGGLWTPDGSLRWFESGFGMTGHWYQPFMIGLAMDSMRAVYRLNGNTDAKNVILDAVPHLYLAHRSDNVGLTSEPYASAAPGGWRGFWYFFGSNECPVPVDPNVQTLCGRVDPAGDLNTIDESRELAAPTVACFGFHYKLTGNPTHLSWFMDIAGACWGRGAGPNADSRSSLIYYREKEFNQNLRAGPTGIAHILGAS